MKFIVDAQLPFKLSSWLKKEGFDVVHTSDLPNQNLTKDNFIIKIAEEQNRVVITKDSDFFEHYLIHGKPDKILMITTGNIVNKELIGLFQANMNQLLSLLIDNQVVELNNEKITVHY
jgi:predicted nuclease of predicted toxin-antitoxin system